MNYDIVSLLESLGLENIRERETEVSASCPMHFQILGREDRHASWSINKETGAHNCFSCGWKGGLATLYLDLTGEIPEDLSLELQKSAFQQNFVEPRDRREFLNAEYDLGEIVPVPEKLLERRHIIPWAADAYGVGWDPERLCWVLPILTESGVLIGAQYRQKGAVFNQPQGVTKSKYLFGLNMVKDRDTVALVESPLDAVRLYGLGIPAVSSFGAGVSRTQLDILNRHFSIVVMALDKDEAGYEATERSSDYLRKLGCAVLHYRYQNLPGKDPGDVEDDNSLVDAWQKTFSLAPH
jgi:hypothetical protein